MAARKSTRKGKHEKKSAMSKATPMSADTGKPGGGKGRVDIFGIVRDETQVAPNSTEANPATKRAAIPKSCRPNGPPVESGLSRRQFS